MIEARRHKWRRASGSCGGAGISPGAGCSGAVSVLVRLADGSGDAAAVRDVVALPAGPLTDACRVSGAPAGAAGRSEERRVGKECRSRWPAGADEEKRQGRTGGGWAREVRADQG